MHRTLTRLSPADRRGRRMHLELDGEPWAEIDSEIVLRRGLCQGLALAPSEIEEILADDEYIRARRAAAILIHTRPRSVAELGRLLAERRFSRPAIERIVLHLKEIGDLDDRRFAEAFARHQFKIRTIGPEKIRHRLRQLGVEEKIIDATLAEEPAACQDSQAALARRFVERRMKRFRNEPIPTRKRKIFQALRRAGFEPDVCATCVDEILKNTDGQESEGENEENRTDLT